MSWFSSRKTVHSRKAGALLAPLFLAGIFAAPAVGLAQDSDGDGIADANDAFPCDDKFAGVVFAPGEGVHGSLLFEDMWPLTGDADFNDLALTYNYVLYTDAQGKVVQLDASFSALAVGGQFDNGLALSLPVGATSVAAVTRSVNRQGAEVLAPSTLDANFTVVLSPNLREFFSGISGPINADNQQPRVDSVGLEVSIMFASGVHIDAATAPFDLFLFRSADPSHEIHQPEYAGSANMNAALFGTGDDGSGPGRSFVDNTGLPFVLVFPDAVPYPSEGVAISNLYPTIATYASSGGAQAVDFYVSPVTTNAYKDSTGQGPLTPAQLNPLSIDQSCVPLTQTTVTFDYTGSSQSWVVPSGVSSVRIEAWGAAGGNGRNGAIGGLGASAAGTISVTPGETLNIVVGQQGGHGTGSSVAGGGGGGGSFITRNGVALVVAGGGGGGSYQAPGNTHGQPGLGTTQGGAGGYSSASAGQGGLSGNGGGGGHGGGGGGFNGAGAGNNWVSGGAKAGGSGAAGYGSYGGYGGFGGGGGSMHGGGGGGGYTGGSAGSYTVGAGGGGSWATGQNPVTASGVQSGNGQVVFTVSGTGGTSTGGGSTGGGNTGGGSTGGGTTTPPTNGNQAFAYTGQIQTFTVPSGVTSVVIEAAGAQGGNGRNGATGARGAFVSGTVAVTPGQTLSIVVGQAGGHGTGSSVAGGGGGGGSFVYASGTPLMIAGGGGGGSYQAPGNTHGQPGLTTRQGGAGGYSVVAEGQGGYTDNGGGGGTGAGGGGWNGNGSGNNWVSGGLAMGGAGGAGYGNYGGYGGFGGGGGSMHGGGGGGGYTGGSGGTYTVGAGGGGSYNAGSNPVERAGDQGGDGAVTIYW